MDGVLANFDKAYHEKLAEVTGRSVPADFVPDRWSWEKSLGYTSHDLDMVWADIKGDQYFWMDMEPYPDNVNALLQWAEYRYFDIDLYFITSRPGYCAKWQTEQWLIMNGIYQPTVLMSSEKGQCCAALNLTHYLDDRDRNAESVVFNSRTKSYLLNRPWNQNRHLPLVTRVDSVAAFLEDLNATH